MKEQKTQFLTVNQLANRWGVTSASIWQKVDKGIIPYINISPGTNQRSIRIPLDFVLEIEGNVQNRAIYSEILSRAKNLLGNAREE